MKFKHIHNIKDIYPYVSDKKEIKFKTNSDGITLGFYNFMDNHTFDSMEAIECRGIAFNESGDVISRPLHKFFNMGEKEFTKESVIRNKKIFAIFEKIDGSMIATAWHKNKLWFRSQKSFSSDVVKLTLNMLKTDEFKHIKDFSTKVASNNMTAIFELTHPESRIVVDPIKPNLRLLHIRDNITGEYVLLDPEHKTHQWIKEHNISTVEHYNKNFDDIIQSLENMKEQEGYVVQFSDGDMVKVKCPWYLNLHHSVTFLRERDIALSILDENIDDIKNLLQEMNVDYSRIESIEKEIKDKLIYLSTSVEKVIQKDKHLSRKDFAIKNKNHPLFSLIMQLYTGKEPDYKEWYKKNKLKDDFSLKVVENKPQKSKLKPK